MFPRESSLSNHRNISDFLILYNTGNTIYNQERESASGRDVTEDTSLDVMIDLSSPRRDMSSGQADLNDSSIALEIRPESSRLCPKSIIEKSADEYSGYRPSHLWLPRGVTKLDFLTAKLPNACLMRYLEVYLSLFEGALGTLVNARGEPRDRSIRNAAAERMAVSILSLVLLPLMPLIISVWSVFTYKSYWDWIGDSAIVSNVNIQPGEMNSVLETTIDALGNELGIKYLISPDNDTPKLRIDVTHVGRGVRYR